MEHKRPRAIQKPLKRGFLTNFLPCFSTSCASEPSNHALQPQKSLFFPSPRALRVEDENLSGFSFFFGSVGKKTKKQHFLSRKKSNTFFPPTTDRQPPPPKCHPPITVLAPRPANGGNYEWGGGTYTPSIGRSG